VRFVPERPQLGGVGCELDDAENGKAERGGASLCWSWERYGAELLGQATCPLCIEATCRRLVLREARAMS
jgi:hypothetical protein